MNFLHFAVGARAQLFYCSVLILFIFVVGSYVFSIKQIESTFAYTEKKVLSMLNRVKVSQFVIVKHTITPTPVIPTTTPTPTDMPSPVTVQNPDNQLINCIGPDGRTLWLTQKDCTHFNNSWGEITPTITQAATDSAQIN